VHATQKRVIVDPKAYANREGYIRDPYVLPPYLFLFSRRTSNHIVSPLREDELYLLPADIKGFNLSEKVCQQCRRMRRSCPENICQSWQKFDVGLLRDVQFDESAWTHLVLDQDTKVRSCCPIVITMLKGGAVPDRVSRPSYAELEHVRWDHLGRDYRQRRRAGMLSSVSVDYRLNERTLEISVLHGPPGTGKTLTAESIAEHLHRPLYMVGFSELSTTSNELEPALKRILSVRAALSSNGAHWLTLCSLQLRGMQSCSSMRQTYVRLKCVGRWVLIIRQVFLEQRSLHEVG
jgi:hypothetical protein